MIGEPNRYDPSEIADHMRKRTPLGLQHLKIIKKYLEARGLKALSDEEVIKWFEDNVKWKLASLGWVSGFRPDYEEATHICAPYVKSLSLDVAVEKGFEVDDLYASRATREGLIKSIRDHDPAFITYNGHGNTNVVTGQDGQVVIIVGDTEMAKLLAGRIINFLSCLAGKELLPWLVRQGVTACAGYKDVYWFTYGDGVERFFFEPHFTFDRKLYAGSSVGESAKAVRQAYQDSFDKAPEGAKPYIMHDLENYVVYGDMDARIKEVFVWSYSLDGMKTWRRIGVSATPEYVWDTSTIPPPPTGSYDNCYVKVSYGDLWDVNDKPFKLVRRRREIVLVEPEGGREYEIGEKIKLKAKILEK